MKCLNCNNTAFYECDTVESVGGYGPSLLPGTGFGLISNAKFNLKICSSCSYVHWFIKKEHMKKIKNSKEFKYRNYKEHRDTTKINEYPENIRVY